MALALEVAWCVICVAATKKVLMVNATDSWVVPPQSHSVAVAGVPRGPVVSVSRPHNNNPGSAWQK